MGAVIEDGVEPALVMEYMDRGSFYDLLHNSTVVMEGELLLPILCDIAQGVRFLHAALPQVIHGMHFDRSNLHNVYAILCRFSFTRMRKTYPRFYFCLT